MRHTLPLTSTLLIAILAACGPAATSEALHGNEDIATIAPAPEEEGGTESSGPAVGDKIGESEAEREAAKAASIAAKAEEAARERADYEARGVREIGWEDLMPEGEEERLAQMYQAQMAMLYGGSPIAEGSAADTMMQIGTFNTVAELNETKVRIPGYTVPFEYSATAEITEFLLVPYFGACIHAPPPPPNQTLFIMTDEPIKLKDLAQAVWIEGTIYTSTQESELADAAYTIELTRIEKYEY